MNYLDYGYDQFLQRKSIQGLNQLNPLQSDYINQEISGSKISDGNILSGNGNLDMDLTNNNFSINDGGINYAKLGLQDNGSIGYSFKDISGNVILDKNGINPGSFIFPIINKNFTSLDIDHGIKFASESLGVGKISIPQLKTNFYIKNSSLVLLNIDMLTYTVNTDPEMYIRLDNVIIGYVNLGTVISKKLSNNLSKFINIAAGNHTLEVLIKFTTNFGGMSFTIITFNTDILLLGKVN